MYPESDGNKGVWLYWDITETWIWTRSDVYPMAWDNFTKTWFGWDFRITKDFYSDQPNGSTTHL